MVRVFGGYCIRDVPARSAPAYVHQLQRKAIIRGSNELRTPSSERRVSDEGLSDGDGMAR